MKAFIFSNKIGSQFDCIINNQPKSLMTLKNGETILGRQLRILKENKIKSVIISTDYFKEDIEKYCHENFSELNFTFVDDLFFDYTNSLYSLTISSYMRHSDFIALHSGLVFDEKVLINLLNNSESNVGYVDFEAKKTETSLKARVLQNKIVKMSPDMFTIDDFVLKPIYKMSSELFRAWLNELKKMNTMGFSDVIAENALSNILNNYDMKSINSSKNYIEEINSIDDYKKVSEGLSKYTFDNQEVYYGHFINRLTEVLNNKQYNRPFIIYDEIVNKNKDFAELANKFNMTLFSKKSIIPNYKEITEGVRLFSDNNCDAIIAIGNGACIDVAKGIKMFLNNNQESLEPVFLKTPLIAVPTTAGSGSEATRYATYYKDGVRKTLINDSLFPNVAVLDPWFLKELSQYERRTSLLLAISQALEGFWSKDATEASREYSARSLALFIDMYKFYNDDFCFADAYMLKGAYFAGQSINIAGVNAVHALGYELSLAADLPLGHALGLLLPNVYEYMFENGKKDKALMETFDRLADIFKTTKDTLAKLFESVLIYLELDTPSISEEVLRKLVYSVDSAELLNSPIVLDKTAIEEIYRKSLTIV